MKRERTLNVVPSPTRRANGRKRVFDVLIVLVASPIALPVGLITAVIVATTIGRPVLFRQERIGLKERRFSVIKFRSMTDERNASGEPLSDAERLTRIGSLIRRTSLDEIPQLWNVLRGDMSLVGPRPLFVRYLPFYTDHERRRHDVRPGITGLAQTQGRNGVNWDDRLKLDVDYVDSVSLAGDLRILRRTAIQSFSGKGVAVVAGESGEPLDILRSYPTSDRFGIRGFVRSDIPYRVAWMNDPAVRSHMRLPAEVDETTTLTWYRATRRSNDREDLVIYDRALRIPRAMLGLKRTPKQALPEIYIFVDPAYAGKGIGRQSLALFFEWLEKESKYEGCTLVVGVENQRALSLYRRFGFTEDGVAESGRIRMSLTFGSWRSRG